MKSTQRIKAGFVINDRFEIVKKVGEGGFAMVFEGRDLNLDRQVAIKVLHGALLGGGDDREKDVLERFEREARLAATVDHGSIVKIYDVGEIAGVDEPFIVMEFLRGCSLQDYIEKHGALDPQKLLPLYQDLLVGGHGHAAGEDRPEDTEANSERFAEQLAQAEIPRKIKRPNQFRATYT